MDLYKEIYIKNSRRFFHMSLFASQNSTEKMWRLRTLGQMILGEIAQARGILTENFGNKSGTRKTKKNEKMINSGAITNSLTVAFFVACFKLFLFHICLTKELHRTPERIWARDPSPQRVAGKKRRKWTNFAPQAVSGLKTNLKKFKKCRFTL